MDDSRPLRFFLQPTDTSHRRYEALRAYFVERRSLGEVAQRFGSRYTALRDLICDFRAQCRGDRVPPFRVTPARAAASRPLRSSARRPGTACRR